MSPVETRSIGRRFRRGRSTYIA